MQQPVASVGTGSKAGHPPQVPAVPGCLLPPGLAALVVGLGMLIYVVHRRMPPIRAIFNTASVMVSTPS